MASDLDPDGITQHLIFQTLTAGLPDVPVYDGPAPAGSPYPRISIGPAQVTDDRSKSNRAWRVFAQIDVYDDTAGFEAAKAIAGRIKGQLDDQVFGLFEGLTFWFCHFTDSRSLDDQDGKTRRVMSDFEFGVQE